MRKLQLSCGDSRFVLTEHEARHIDVLKELDFDNCEKTINVDGLVTRDALEKIIEYAHQDKRNTKAYSVRKLITNKRSDYMSSWETAWVTQLDKHLLKDVLAACHALHYDAPKYVCLHHILLSKDGN